MYRSLHMCRCLRDPPKRCTRFKKNNRLFRDFLRIFLEKRIIAKVYEIFTLSYAPRREYGRRKEQGPAKGGRGRRISCFGKNIENIAENLIFIFLKMLIWFVKGICQTLREQCQIFRRTSRNGLQTDEISKMTS